MLLNELNLKALNVSAESVLPVEKNLCVEGKEVTFKITSFQSGFGSGKKSVISGSVSHEGTTYTLENSDIESIRRKVSKLLGIKTTNARQPRAMKSNTEVEKLRASLAVARRVSCSWLSIDADKLREAYKTARQTDRENARKALQARAVDPLLVKIQKLSAEERALLLASLQ